MGRAIVRTVTLVASWTAVFETAYQIPGGHAGMSLVEWIGIAAIFVGPLIGFHWRTWVKIDRLTNRVGVEHEMLMVEYCERNGKDIEKLPTRVKGVF